MADVPKQQQIAMDAAVARTLQEKESGGAKKSRYGAKSSSSFGGTWRYGENDDDDFFGDSFNDSASGGYGNVGEFSSNTKKYEYTGARLRKDSRTIRNLIRSIF